MRKLRLLFLAVVGVMFLAAAPLLAQDPQPTAAPFGTVPFQTLARIVIVLVGARVVYFGVNGLKDVFPAYFASHPMASRIWNGIGQILIVIIACMGGDHPTMDMNIMAIGACVLTGIVGFLNSAGIHEEKKVENLARASATVKGFESAKGDDSGSGKS